MGSGTELAFFAAIIAVFSLMGALFWLVGRRELRRQEESARARERADTAELIAVFELAALADRVVLDARRRALELADAETVAPAERGR